MISLHGRKKSSWTSVWRLLYNQSLFRCCFFCLLRPALLVGLVNPTKTHKKNQYSISVEKCWLVKRGIELATPGLVDQCFTTWPSPLTKATVWLYLLSSSMQLLLTPIPFTFPYHFTILYGIMGETLHVYQTLSKHSWQCLHSSEVLFSNESFC